MNLTNMTKNISTINSHYVLDSKDLKTIFNILHKSNHRTHPGVVSYTLSGMKNLLNVNSWEALNIYPEKQQLPIALDSALLNLAYEKDFQGMSVNLNFPWITSVLYYNGKSTLRQIGKHLQKRGFDFYGWIGENLLKYDVRHDLMEEYANTLVKKIHTPDEKGLQIAYQVLECYNQIESKYLEVFLLDMIQFCCDNMHKMDANLVKQEVARFAVKHKAISNKAYPRYKALVDSLNPKDFEHYLQTTKALQDFFQPEAPGVKISKTDNGYTYVFNVANMSRNTQIPMNRISLSLGVLTSVLKSEFPDDVSWHYTRKIGQLDLSISQEHMLYVQKYINEIFEYIQNNEIFISDATAMLHKNRLENHLPEQTVPRKLKKI